MQPPFALSQNETNIGVEGKNRNRFTYVFVVHSLIYTFHFTCAYATTNHNKSNRKYEVYKHPNAWTHICWAVHIYDVIRATHPYRRNAKNRVYARTKTISMIFCCVFFLLFSLLLFVSFVCTKLKSVLVAILSY